MILKRNRRRKFHKNQLQESLCDLRNPGRGWYHIYTYDLSKELPELYIACEEESIALLLIDISHFRKECISDRALAYLERILGFFQKNEKKVILRPVYDTEGHGMEREPARISLVKEHMHKLGPVIEKYAKNILVVQGILVGDWGEMHGSKFLSKQWLSELAVEYLEAMHYSCYLAVRTPTQWRTIADTADDRAKERLTIFNDGIFGSDTDLGTFRNREERSEWLNRQVRGRNIGPVGGEVVSAWVDGLLDPDMTDAFKEQNMTDVKDLGKMHLTYLNSVHDLRLLESWKSQMINWNGHKTSIYDYVGLHLGYRFIIRDVVWKKDKFLEVHVENSGFAEIYEETECQIELRVVSGESKVTDNLSEKRVTFLMDCDARKWKSGTVSKIQIPAHEIESHMKNVEKSLEQKVEIYLHLQCKRGKIPVLFANADADNGVLLGTFR